METLCKAERLTGKVFFDELMKTGTAVKAFPIKAVWMEKMIESNFPVKAAFVVPKKKFGKAVDRNKLKRRMREVYRKNKMTLYNNLGSKKIIVLFIYIAPEIAEYTTIENAIKSTLTKIGSTK